MRLDGSCECVGCTMPATHTLKLAPGVVYADRPYSLDLCDSHATQGWRAHKNRPGTVLVNHDRAARVARITA